MVPVPLRIREYHRAGVTLKGTAVSVRGERNSAEGAAGAKWPPLFPSTFSKGKVNAANAADERVPLPSGQPYQSFGGFRIRRESICCLHYNQADKCGYTGNKFPQATEKLKREREGLQDAFM